MPLLYIVGTFNHAKLWVLSQVLSNNCAYFLTFLDTFGLGQSRLFHTSELSLPGHQDHQSPGEACRHLPVRTGLVCKASGAKGILRPTHVHHHHDHHGLPTKSHDKCQQKRRAASQFLKLDFCLQNILIRYIL